MSAHAGVRDQNKLHSGHLSTKVLAPPGGGRSQISLGGGPPRQMQRRPMQNRGGNQQGGRSPQQNRGNSNQAAKNRELKGNNIFGGPTQNQTRVEQMKARQNFNQQHKSPQARMNAQRAKPMGGQSAGQSGGQIGGQKKKGASRLRNTGGYGNLDIHSKPSTKVHAPPGGGSSIGFNGQGNAPQKKGGVKRVPQNTKKGKNTGALRNTGGYGNLDIHSKPSTKVHAPPGGGSQIGFGGGGGNVRKTGVKKIAAPTGKGGSLRNNGGYGNLDIHSRASTKVHAPPGGGSNISLSGGSIAKKKAGYRDPNQSSMQRNEMKKTSTRVKAPPGGGSNFNPTGGRSGGKKTTTSVKHAPGGGSSIRMDGGGSTGYKQGRAGHGQTQNQSRGNQGRNISTKVKQAPGGGSSINMSGGGSPRRGGGGVKRVPQNQGGKRNTGALRNAGGYGNLDIHSRASTKVHAPPGGGSNISMGGCGAGPQRKGGVKRVQQKGNTRNTGALRNAGGYGNLDIHSRASTKVHAPPGGGSSFKVG